MSVLTEKTILLGVTGSVAAYKAAALASQLTQAGALVETILTPGAEKFVTPLTFQSVTGRRAYTDSDLWGSEAHVLHIGLARRADVFLIAPCTANTLAKLAHGIADTLLTVAALAATCPLVIAPAMDAGMYAHVAVQENVHLLRERGVVLVGPAEGHLASGLRGVGRMSEVEEIIGHVRLVLGREGALAGRRVVVTAGGTQEPLDPVRHITNRSTGRQGYALAQAALDAGAQVTLITAPTCLRPPVGARVVPVRTAQEMLEAVLEESAHADALLMAAAVADFRPARIATEKISKKDGIPTLPLEATPDILKTLAARDGKERKRPRLVIGFAAESRDLLKNARAKLQAKRLDLIVANDISASDSGFAVETNRVTLLYAAGREERLPLMSKEGVAEIIIARLATLLENTNHAHSRHL